MRNTDLALLSFALLLSGCSAGPDFVRPEAPKSTRYTSTEVASRIEAEHIGREEAQIVVQGEVSDSWWEAFNAPKLNGLIAEALIKNPTLESAAATLRQAEYLYKAKGGSTLYPRIDAVSGARREGINGSMTGQEGSQKTFNLFNASLVAGYTFDLSGGNRRQLESLAAKAGYQRFQLAGARLMLAADIASTAIRQAELSGQIAAMEKILDARRQQLQITRERQRLGASSGAEVLAMQAVAEQARAVLPGLRQQLAETRHLLAIFAGQSPDRGEIPSFLLQDFTLPRTLPLRVPSSLVRVRPDIQASEALMKAANADYGAAIAKSFPQITLGVDIGSTALTLASLFGGGSLVWGVGGQLVQPLFNRGTGAEQDAAKAGFDAAAANYRQSVLKGLKEVADVLTALENDAQTLSACRDADEAIQAELRIMESRYRLGSASFLEMLQAQGEAEQYRIELIKAESRRLSDTVAFYQAMGGSGK
ncbi:MAG: efflux transporter outer membrane subunit [Chlorobium sp.]|jgi:NodT family efflux transporter outer membrane factor (OMF) lipoprotein|nr:efflux transporter outer membrane subunit [Chlorobium sp.]